RSIKASTAWEVGNDDSATWVVRNDNSATWTAAARGVGRSPPISIITLKPFIDEVAVAILHERIDSPVLAVDEEFGHCRLRADGVMLHHREVDRLDQERATRPSIRDWTTTN